MSVRQDGSAGLQFVTDVIELLKINWKSSNVKIPNIDKVWDRKVTGLVQNKARDVLITLDVETVGIFSIQQRDGNNKPFWDWLHDVSLSIEVRTGTSIDDALNIVSEITRIFKENVGSVLINNNEYVQMLPGTVTSHNEEFRNLFRYIMDVSAMKYNP